MSGRVAVIGGTGQVANKDDERIVHPMVLVEEATRAALDAAGVKPGDVSAIYCTPLSAIAEADPAGMLAERLGARSGPRHVSNYSGSAPQKMLSAAVRAVSEGRADVAVVAGGIADASFRRARRTGRPLPAPPTSVWSQGSDGIGVEVHRDWGPSYIAEIAAGAGYPSSYFALVQSALDRGKIRSAQERALGELMAPFTEVAARRPDLAWFPVARSPEEIAAPSAANRLVAEPYTKLMCSFPTVDLAAALVVTADPGPGAIYPRVITVGTEEGTPSTWADMSHSKAMAGAVRRAFELSGLDPSEVGAFDLYSCFPAAVLLAAGELGVGPGDPRPLTASGGLPYFGGPGASYSLHGLACLFEDMHSRSLPLGAAVGVGGMVNYSSVGIYSLDPVPFAWAEDEPVPVQVESNPAPQGRAMVDAMTVLHDRDGGPVAAPIIGRTAGGARFGARLADPAEAAELAGTSLVGTEVEVVSEGGQTRYRVVG
ncbi:MAG TPA: hypothetical protein VFH70_11680 [Acidimicrobiales bacterium]|nr:hypothetical protein [Acidimicrobiales bacterium]